MQLSGAFTVELDVERLADAIADRLTDRVAARVAGLLADGTADPDRGGHADRRLTADLADDELDGGPLGGRHGVEP